jgi:protoporphyrinogen/coproporphyrinogen III oxidase
MIAIIGGGMSGLAAAYELTRRQRPFILFEASDRLGGLIRTEHVHGFTIEAGADSMLVQKRAALDLCEELGLAPHLLSMKAPRTAFVLHDGRLKPLPAGSFLGLPSTWRSLAFYALLPLAARARLALEPLIPSMTGTHDESIAEFFSRRFGPATVHRLAQPLLGGIHAGDVQKLSLRALFPRLVEAERSGSVLRWARRTVRGRRTEGPFRSLPGGMSDLVRAIEKRLPTDAIHRQEDVHSVARADTAWNVTTERQTVAARAVIFACPAYVAGSLLASIDADAAQICGSVPYVSTVSVALAWPRHAVGHPLEGSGFVVGRRSDDGRLTACTWVSSKWDHRAPAGHVLLRAYLGGDHDPDAVDLDDAAIIEVVVRELSAILSITGAPDLARVYRWRQQGAQHTVGHLARIAELQRALSRHQGLLVTGSGFRAIGIPDCIADGRSVAAEAGAFAYDQ